jgi:hypothetical protein
MTERLMAKLDRLGAEAGIKEMTPEIYRFSQLLNDDKLQRWDEWRSQRTWVGLTDEQLHTEFGKLYPNDIGILELAENNRDFAIEAIGARHHWVAFQAGARAAEAKLKELNT